MTQPIRKAVFPVGGLGTRFLPATKALPKEMLPVVDKPLIQYAVEEARAAGIEDIIFVTGRGKSAIEDHFDHSYELEDILKLREKRDILEDLTSLLPAEGHVSYTRQLVPMGLGHAVWCARNLIGDEPFAVLLADDLVQAQTPCLKQMINVYEQTGGNVVAVMEVPREHVSRYGVIAPGADTGDIVEVAGLVEKPTVDDAPSNLCVIGRYILQPDVFEHLDKKKPGAGSEIQLTDAMASMIGRKPFYGLRFAGVRYDCGDKLGYLKANIAFALDRPDLSAELAAYLDTLAL